MNLHTHRNIFFIPSLNRSESIVFSSLISVIGWVIYSWPIVLPVYFLFLWFFIITVIWNIKIQSCSWMGLSVCALLSSNNSPNIIILTEVFHGFSQCIQAYIRVVLVPWIRPWLLPPVSFPIIHQSFWHSVVYNLRATDTFIEKTTEK